MRVVRFPLVVFDLDGTLVDSLADIAAALNHALADAGLQPLGLDHVRSLVGDGVAALVQRAVDGQPAGGQGGASAPLVDAMVARYNQFPCVATRPYPQIPALLDRLRSDGCRLAVLTNKPGPLARALLEAVALTPWFDAIIGDGDGFPRKPDPGALVQLAARHALAPESVLMVGDGVPDLAVARAFGCASAAAGWGYVAPDVLRAEAPTFWLNEPLDLLGLPATR